MYPAFAVLATTALGVYLTYVLWAQRRLARLEAAVLVSVFLGKLGTLLLDTPWAIVSTTVLIFPMLDVWTRDVVPPTTSGAVSSRPSSASHGPARPSGTTVTPTHAILYTLAVGVATFWARTEMPARIISYFTGTEASEAQLLGTVRRPCHLRTHGRARAGVRLCLPPPPRLIRCPR